MIYFYIFLYLIYSIVTFYLGFRFAGFLTKWKRKQTRNKNKRLKQKQKQKQNAVRNNRNGFYKNITTSKKNKYKPKWKSKTQQYKLQSY